MNLPCLLVALLAGSSLADLPPRGASGVELFISAWSPETAQVIGTKHTRGVSRRWISMSRGT